MALSNAIIPKSVTELDDRHGTVYKFERVQVRGAGSIRIEQGQPASQALLIDGPSGFSASNFYFSVPNPDDVTQIKIDNQLNSPDGEYTVVVIFRGRNAAAL